MLTYFRVKGFRGFKDSIVFDLGKTGNYQFNGGEVLGGVVQKALVYGKNGAGKSNLGHAILDIARTTRPDSPLPSEFAFSFAYGSGDEPVEFEYGFRFERHDVRYLYRKTNPVDLNYETLAVDGKPVIAMKGDKPEVVENTLLPIADFKIGQGRSLLFSLISLIDLEEGNPLRKLGEFVRGMLFFRSLNHGNEAFGIDLRYELIEDAIISQGKTKDFEAFLRGYGGIDLQLEEAQSQVIDQYLRRRAKFLAVRYGKRLIPFGHVGSSGTLSLLVFYYWYLRMQKRSFVFIDEFDAFYHYELSGGIIELLRSIPDVQIVLTTHNTALMNNDLMRPDTLFLLSDGVIKPLCDCTKTELRQAHNLEKIYRSGGFGIEG